MNSTFLSRFQVRRDAFLGLVNEEVYRLRGVDGEWQFGSDTIASAAHFFLNGQPLSSRIEVGLVNEPSMTATWFKKPDEQDAYAIGINQGLITALETIAFDVFGYGKEEDGEPLRLGTYEKVAAERVAERVAAFLEIGCPLGNAVSPSAQRVPFVKALVEDAMQFLVLHEFAHILLGHDRGHVHLLRNRMVDLQIATFSIGQEHAADKLAARLHASIRRSSAQSFPGLEFSGPTLFFSVLGLFERYARYKAAFETPHAHPNAYERLYRLRVEFTTGGGHMYWSIPQGDSQTLARTDLEPNPDAVKFADAIAKSLLNVIEEIEGSEMLPSPFNSIFNRFCAADITPHVNDEFFHEIALWLFLGSPTKVIQHLVEARNGIAHSMAENPSEDDSIFLERSKCLIDSVIPRINQIKDYSVQQALRRTADRFEPTEPN
ncbi:hypothetical protein ACQ4WY_25700 [Janthinobacterium sp. LB2P49]|uniref:hypothetical protein n=1 Tax=Janthinobacterium sp. LB2P49 TaxID=3424198 RepID=UPI003F2801F8